MRPSIPPRDPPRSCRRTTRPGSTGAGASWSASNPPRTAGPSRPWSVPSGTSEGLRLGLRPKPDTHPFLEHFDYLFRLAADADARGLALASFVSELEPRAGTPERLPDLDAPREAGSGRGSSRSTRPRAWSSRWSSSPSWTAAGNPGATARPGTSPGSTESTLNLKPWDEPGAKTVNLFFDLARDEEARQEAAERKRLFYVACTRASGPPGVRRRGARDPRTSGAPPSTPCWRAGTDGGTKTPGTFAA
ncbi:MAG: hypothetical protein MZV64_09530 [Ignavibacteriales bacterium]|nr:hypothetical protein [Ignavibacteriales bacterium]